MTLTHPKATARGITMPKSTRRTPSSRASSRSDDAGRVTNILAGAVQGIGDIALEVGSTATSAVQGSIGAVERIGGDLVAVTRSAIEGGLDSVARISAAASRAMRRMMPGDGAASTGAASVKPNVRPRRSRKRKTVKET